MLPSWKGVSQDHFPFMEGDHSIRPSIMSFVVVLEFYLFVYLFIFGCAGSSLLCGLFPSCGKQGLLLVAVPRLSWQWLLLWWSMVSRVHGLQ